MTTTEEGLKARNALSLIVGLARAHRELAADGVPVDEARFLDVLARIEEHGYGAMPWLREIKDYRDCG